MADTTTNLANLPLNCPRCGKPLRYLHARTPDGTIVGDSQAADPSTVYIYRCAEHGSFRFSPEIPVKPGA